MKRSTKAVALLLVVTFILGVTGCAKKLTRQELISGFESYGVKETDDLAVLTNHMNRQGGDNGYYVAKDKEEAGKWSNAIMNRFKTMPDIIADDFVLAVVSEKGSNDKFYMTFVCYVTLENDAKAKEAYNNLVDAHGDKENGKTGTSSSITYCIDSGVSAAGTNKIGTGIYLQGNTVIFLRAQAAVDDDYKFADAVCGKLGLLSPSKA
jgi:hypothetical protein